MSTWRAEEWGNSTSNLGLLSGCDPQKDREHLNLYPIQTASSKTSHKKLKQEIVLIVFVRPTWHSVNQAQSFWSVSTAPRAESSPWMAHPVRRWTQPPHRFKDCCLLQPHYNSRFDAVFFFLSANYSRISILTPFHCWVTTSLARVHSKKRLRDKNIAEEFKWPSNWKLDSA